MEGWIKIHRKLLEWQWITSPNHLSLFMHLLLLANHKETKWRKVTLLPGQLLTGRDKLHQITRISHQSIRTVLKDLKSTNEITIKTTTKYSIITILNWETYQLGNQPTNQQLTNKQPTTNQQLTTSNNDKKYNNEKNEIIYNYGFKQVWLNYPTRSGRKRGRELAFKLYKSNISENEQSDFLKAVKNYAKDKETIAGFAIKDCANFILEDFWRDFVNVDEEDKEKIKEDQINYIKKNEKEAKEREHIKAEWEKEELIKNK